jgi:hypothetical protein
VLRLVAFGAVAWVASVVVLCAFLRAANGSGTSRVVRTFNRADLDFALWERELAKAAQ